MSQFSFEYPYLLGIILLFLLCARYCRERSRAIYFPHIERLLLQGGAKKSSLLLWLKWIGIVGAVVALASPVLTKEYQNSHKEGRDIVLVIDASDSMRQRGFDPNDIRKNKFDVVKEVVNDFIDKRSNDRIGVVTFADVAFIASPLTFEKKFLKDIVAYQQLGIAGKRTAINDALVQTYGMLSKSKAKSKIAILLTDGRDNMSKVAFEDIKNIVAKSDVKLYTIGIGSPRDYNGRYLQALADAGKGRAYGAHNSEMLTEIYREIDKLEASQLNDKKVVQHTYLYIYPLFLAILALLFFVYFRNARGA
ncbi:MAG TPA: VWA domain-containing protein [Epsilonproteobacteria bacterium]|nr:VWA domain-containing protein [Campylobacterota bacterium]HHD72439.1 VWA domain-containing protein [Campylobacterota bacterium]